MLLDQVGIGVLEKAQAGCTWLGLNQRLPHLEQSGKFRSTGILNDATTDRPGEYLHLLTATRFFKHTPTRFKEDKKTMFQRAAST